MPHIWDATRDMRVKRSEASLDPRTLGSQPRSGIAVILIATRCFALAADSRELASYRDPSHR